MTGGVNFSITADDAKIRVRFEQLPRDVRIALRQKITELTNQLLRQVKAREPRRTGRLQARTRSYVDERKDYVRGRVRVIRGKAHNTAAAAGALEYGAHRSFTVRSHRQRRTAVFGNSMQPQSVMVAAYQRRANITAQRFLRTPAAAMLPHARREIEEIIRSTFAKVERP